jgi:hypothetical protein
VGVVAGHRLWDGPGNVREIAQEVGESHAYESFYRIWSESVHVQRRTSYPTRNVWSSAGGVN